MKKSFLILLSIVLGVSNSFLVYGQDLKKLEVEELNINDSIDLENRLDFLEKRYDNFEFNILPEYERSIKEPILKFNTIDDFENYLKENESKINNDTIILNLNNIDSRSYNSVETFSKWQPYSIFNVLCYFNVDVNYEYDINRNGKYFVGVNDVSSYLSGLNVALDWIQTSYVETIRNSGKELEISINGYFHNYVDIAGISVGFKDKRTYTFIGKFN